VVASATPSATSRVRPVANKTPREKGTAFLLLMFFWTCYLLAHQQHASLTRKRAGGSAAAVRGWGGGGSESFLGGPCWAKSQWGENRRKRRK
jgi:hypothetical protein